MLYKSPFNWVIIYVVLHPLQIATVKAIRCFCQRHTATWKHVTKPKPPLNRTWLPTSCQLPERMWRNKNQIPPFFSLQSHMGVAIGVNLPGHSLTWVRIFLVSISSSSEGQLPFRGLFFHLFDPITAIQFGSLVWQHFILWKRQITA